MSMAQGLNQTWSLTNQKLIISPGPDPINQSLFSGLQGLSRTFTLSRHIVPLALEEETSLPQALLMAAAITGKFQTYQFLHFRTL